MTSSVEDITIAYSEDGQLLVKELDKVILSKGAWTTILFQLQDWDRKKSEFGPIKYAIRRYQKKDGVYKPRAKFNISSNDQAKKIIEALNKWLGDATQ